MSDSTDHPTGTRWIPAASLVISVSIAAIILATHSMPGHGDPHDAMRTTIRATGMWSALLFAAALFGRSAALRLDLHRGVLASHAVHGIALLASGLLFSPHRLGEIARQSHVVFALFPDWTPIVLGSLGYAALGLLARASIKHAPVREKAAQGWLLTLFLSFYLDALVSHASEGPLTWVVYGSLIAVLMAGAASRWRHRQHEVIGYTPMPVPEA